MIPLVIIGLVLGTGMVFTLVAIVTILFIIIVCNFYRDPDRTTPAGEGIIIAPADGKIVRIAERSEPLFVREDSVQVSIFMSPADVHVNRIPVSGTVGYFEHIPGSYKVAFDDKSSDENERTLIGIDYGTGRLLFKQISGALARRIVADVSVGKKVQIGERFGMIKLGSRVDVIMPKDWAVQVRMNDRVIAGETIIARRAPANG